MEKYTSHYVRTAEHIQQLRDRMKGKRMWLTHPRGMLGKTPWNKGLKGSVKPNKTSFTKGLAPWNKGLKTEDDARLDYDRPTKMKPGHYNPKAYIMTPERLKKMSDITKKRLANPADHPNWQGGLSFEPYSLQWTSTLRVTIRERDNYTCQVCHKKQDQQAFDVHHINYVKTDCSFTNLITLCHSCHSKTNKKEKRAYWTNHFNNLIKQKYE